MSKRAVILIGTAVVVLLAAGGMVYSTARSTSMAPHFWAKAKDTKAAVACLADNPKLNVPKNALNDIEMRALTYLSDVPAGTNVDVKLATYSPTKVTGSDYYPTRYGAYNFAMTKDRDGWHFTDFEHCY